PCQSGQGRELSQPEGAMAIASMLETALPGDADLEAADWAELTAPVLDQRLIGAEVGNLGRDGSQGRAEDARQAHQGSLYRELRQCVIASEQLRDTLAARQEPDQRSLAGHDHAAAALLDQRGVADELEHVAQSLLRIEQDRSSIQVGAIPARLAGGGWRRLFALPPPFILGPPQLEVATAKPGQCSIQ